MNSITFTFSPIPGGMVTIPMIFDNTISEDEQHLYIIKNVLFSINDGSFNKLQIAHYPYPVISDYNPLGGLTIYSIPSDIPIKMTITWSNCRAKLGTIGTLYSYINGNVYANVIYDGWNFTDGTFLQYNQNELLSVDSWSNTGFEPWSDNSYKSFSNLTFTPLKI